MIREATPADADDLTQLARRAKASWGYPEAWLREWQPQLSFSAAYIGSNPVYVVTSDDTLAGVIALEDSAEPEIAHLWVSPEYQGLGVGRQLVQRAIEVAAERGWNSYRVESDPHALPFYERLGAVQIGEVAAPVCGVERVLPVLRLTV